MKSPHTQFVDGKHEAIIDEDLFYRAKNKILRYPSVKPNNTLQNPFASILKCECGRCMRRSKDRKGFRYMCDEQTLCGNASVREQDLIEEVIKHLKKGLKDLSAKVTDDDNSKKEKHMEYVSLLEAKYVDIEKKELSLWDKYAEEQMPKQIFDKLMADCTEKKKTIENELEKAYNDVPEHIDYKGAVSSLHEAIEALSNDSISASAKNNILLSVVDKIVYHRKKPIRMTEEEAKEKGLKTSNGWYSPKFKLEIYLKM